MASTEAKDSSGSDQKGVFDLFASWKKKEEPEKETFLGLLTPKDGKSESSEFSGEDDSVWTPLEERKTEEHEEGGKNQLEESGSEKTSMGGGAWGGLSNIITSLTSSGKDGESNIESLLQKARDFAAKDDDFKESKSGDELNKLRVEVDAVLGQLQKSFGHIAIDKISPIAFLYFLEHEDSIKTPSWKRRKHRFLPSLDLTTVHAMHDALYLSEISYCDSVDEVQAGLQAYEGSPYEMIYCSVEGQPRQPAHYIAIKKDLSEDKSAGFSLPWQKNEKSLEVLMVIRGTKEISDLLSDALLEACEYREGMAHSGIAESGKWLVEKHTALLEHLLEESKYSKIRLSLVGHSLGAGAAAIAAMEFSSHPNITATSIGFGCPALLSKELSEGSKDYITTVISDSDVVPRMSGSTVANVLQDVMSLDFTEQAVDDATELLHVAKENAPFPVPEDKIDDAVQWVRGEIEKGVKSSMECVSEKRSEIVLFPPGKCVHLFRDGVGVSASYVPCDFFSAIDVSRTMVGDHYVATGYNRVFLELMRGHKQDSRFEFRHDVAGLRIEKEKRTKLAESGGKPDEEKRN